MKWEANKKADEDTPVVTVTLSRREIALLYMTAGSHDNALKVSADFWQSIEALAAEYGQARFDVTPLTDESLHRHLR